MTKMTKCIFLQVFCDPGYPWCDHAGHWDEISVSINLSFANLCQTFLLVFNLLSKQAWFKTNSHRIIPT